MRTLWRAVAFPAPLLVVHLGVLALPVARACAALCRTVLAEPWRLALDSADAHFLLLARRLFHASTLVPLVLYHFRASDPAPKFPATISHTVRWGVPRLVNVVLWVAGWTVMLHVIVRRAESWLVVGFALQMIFTGVICTQVCPIGSGGRHGALRDRIHVLTATAYIADHVLLCGLLKLRALHQAGFYGGFAGLLAASYAKGLVEQRAAGHGSAAAALLTETPADGDETLARIAADPRLSRLHWLARLAVMICEYGLFLSFVEGIGSDLDVAASATVEAAPEPLSPAPSASSDPGWSSESDSGWWPDRTAATGGLLATAATIVGTVLLS